MYKIIFISLMLVSTLSACSKSLDTESRRLSKLRPTPEALDTIETNVSKQKLTHALEDVQAVERLRLIQVFAGPTRNSALPEYRMFNISSGSAYDLLGLKNADVLIAADDRVLANTEVFKQFVRLLPQEKEAQIEVRREGKPVLLKYTFVE